MLADRRSSRSFMAPTSGAISEGAACSSMGERSSGRRARRRCCSALSGATPRDRPNHTSSTAIGSTTNCGMMTPLMMSLASWARFSTVSATITRAGWVSGRPRSIQV
ncbi:Uncharacterised protein [Bordetella pertussis]|nr:Uncharacterised protein [Bordetella pertussis]